MPKADNEKTKSAPKLSSRRGLIAVSAVFAVSVISFGILRYNSMNDHLNVNGHNYRLLLATTPAVQEKGLGDRVSLPTDEGMLFTFSGPAMRCFWMKDMHFPIDMIWLNDHKQIVHIQPDVSPNTYPKVFCPQTPAMYVLEVNAGQAQAADMQIGQKLNF